MKNVEKTYQPMTVTRVGTVDEVVQYALVAKISDIATDARS